MDSVPRQTLEGAAATGSRFRRRRWLVIAAAAVAVAGCIVAAWCFFQPACDWTRGIEYGRRHGEPLMLDVLRPRSANGLGIVVIVSGGWRSDPDTVRPWLVAPLLRRGFTVFAVGHVSQPKASVAEIFADVSRGVRYVRTHADEYGIDPDRIGVGGGSAGGHLALLLATRGGPGPADAVDPVDRASSRVQAAAVFFPVTDLTNLAGSTEDPGDGGPPIHFRAAFRQEPVDMATWRPQAHELSPIYHVTAELPPVLIHHGDRDTLVTLDQSVRFRDRAREAGADVTLVTVAGGGHGWLTMPLDVMRFAAFFDRALRPEP
jgi:acetyl esterase/lipase